MLDDEESSAPDLEQTSILNVREVMAQTVNKLEQANAHLGGSLLIPFGRDATRTLLFETPTTRQETLPDGNSRKVAVFLAVTQDGYKVIEVDTSGPPASWNLNRAEISYGIVGDVQSNIRRKHEPYYGSERVGYIKGKGLALEGDVVVGDSGTSTLEIIDRKPGNPNEYIYGKKTVPGIRLNESPAPEVVTEILRLNKERAEQAKAKAEEQVQAPRQQEQQDLNTATSVV